jgi:high affinity Mn2+ porin
MNHLLQFLLPITLILALQITGRAQTPNDKDSQDSPSVDSKDESTIFEHSQTGRFWVSGQINVILQWHPSFSAKYSGDNSLRARGENATSRVLTLYTGIQLTKTTEILVDVESAGGRGISDAFGLGGFTNLDVVRNPTLGSTPYLARAMLHQIIPLSGQTSESERGPLSLATQLPVRRLEIRAGKFGTADFFDVNSAGSDSHLQFMNWTVDNNGAYDYAADTRGYTVGVLVEYQDRNWGLRFGECLMPKVANGIELDWNLHRARGENLELELRHSLVRKRTGVVRLLAYANHANMGSYREAINAFRPGPGGVPDIEASRRQGRVKYGFGMNIEQEIAKGITVFGRLGWNEGHHESFAYTEVDNTVEFGSALSGAIWHRKFDRVGVAFVSNGISKDHSDYLALGGKGFLLGDGALTYGREQIFESYYTAHMWRGVFGSLDLQYITNPGYNRDRGPAVVPAIRMHLEF